MSDSRPWFMRLDDRWLWWLLFLAFFIFIHVKCIEAQQRLLDLSAGRTVGAFQQACETAGKGMTPAMLFSHFPRGTYNPRCLSETQDCGEFESVDGTLRHFPCPEGDCAMYWQQSERTCRIDLSDHKHMGLGDGVITNDNHLRPVPKGPKRPW